MVTKSDTSELRPAVTPSPRSVCFVGIFDLVLGEFVEERHFLEDLPPEVLPSLSSSINELFTSGDFEMTSYLLTDPEPPITTPPREAVYLAGDYFFLGCPIEDDPKALAMVIALSSANLGLMLSWSRQLGRRIGRKGRSVLDALGGQGLISANQVSTIAPPDSGLQRR